MLSRLQSVQIKHATHHWIKIKSPKSSSALYVSNLQISPLLSPSTKKYVFALYCKVNFSEENKKQEQQVTHQQNPSAYFTLDFFLPDLG